MKKITMIFLILFALSMPVFSEEGDGTMPGGGKTCPNGQTTCREAPAEDSFIKVIDLLISIFV